MPQLLRLVVALMIAGCAPAKDDGLALRVDSLEAQLDTLSQRVRRHLIDDLIKANDIAFLRPADQGYSLIDTDYGRITVRLVDVVAYANGSRVTLQFGNTTAATLNDVTATLDWGKADSKGNPDNSSERSREITFERAIQPGSWTSLTVVLEGVPPSELGFVRVSQFSNKGISLRR